MYHTLMFIIILYRRHSCPQFTDEAVKAHRGGCALSRTIAVSLPSKHGFSAKHVPNTVWRLPHPTR